MTSSSALVAHGSPAAFFTFASLTALGVPNATTTKHCPGISSFAEPIVPEAPKPPKTPGRTRRHVEDTWRHVSEALLGVATAKAIDYISNVIPGFRDHYQSTTGRTEY